MADLILNSKAIKQFIAAEIDKKDIDIIKLCKKLGIDRQDMTYFLFRQNAKLDHQQVSDIIAELGGELRVTIYYNPDYETDKTILR